ncbi:hypothetical protein KUTeg_019098 [Tegillarca granosa]|uniref:Glutathione synthase n=1 Tax=Tegillarca granosa TaxID=220873 RepID=A0ABQ9EFL6_TEGGR|nr:hypothetical protein KUTeg_019098 [Tegillarca granosa]
MYVYFQEWHARLMIERSKAIKSPTVHYQLAGTKKIQQELARPGAVEKYISDNTAVNKIRSTFVGQHSLDLDGEGDKAVLLGINRPHDFVLKPQREGGGNNIYGEDIKDFLVKHQNSEERLGYILMERIYPWPQKNHLLKVGEDIRLCDIVNEIGIYGVYIGDSDTEYENKQVGHLMRSKTLGVDEGGIAAGFATLDTPLLVE